MAKPSGHPAPSTVGSTCLDSHTDDLASIKASVAPPGGSQLEDGSATETGLRKRSGLLAVLPTQPSWRTPGSTLGSAAEDDLAALGMAGPLPPVSGGTTFGAEMAAQPRMRWESRTQFVLVLAGYCIGIGNLWRFPYLCGKCGGGAFLIAYITMLFVAAAPLFFYETVLGQKFQRGPTETFRKMAPRWASLAYLPVVMAVCSLPYYQMLVTYAFHYMLASFQWPLPWKGDPHRYLQQTVLNEVSLGAEHSWAIHGRLLGEYFAVWLITALCLVKGIHSAGKAAYVTVIMPVVMIVILFLRTIFLPGAGDGIKYYLTPRWEMLFRLDVWGNAAAQIIFSLSPGMGCCISLASYHPREYRGLLTDCARIIVANSAFSIFGGFVVFSVVGNLAHRDPSRRVEDIAATGEGLAFIAFAQSLTELGRDWVCSMFSFFFFLTLFLLGLDSAFAVVETLQTYINDWLLSRNPTQKIRSRGSAIRLVFLTTFLFILGLPYTTRGGYHLVEISDHYIPTYILLFTVLFEYLMIGFWYTGDQMLEDVYQSTGVRLPRWCIYQIKMVAPIVLELVLFMLLVSERHGSHVTEDDDDRSPTTPAPQLQPIVENLTILEKYPLWIVLFFGVFPVLFAFAAFLLPIVRFHMRRYAFSKTLAPAGFAAAKKRAEGGGMHTVPDAPIVINRS